MFEAGALIFRIQAMGAEVFKKELQESEAAVTKAGTAAKTSAKSTEELGAKQDGTAKKTKDATKATDELGKSQTSTKQRTDEAAKSTQANGKALMGMSEDAKRASREVGQAAVGIGASFVAVAGLSAKAAMDWESQWAGVTKTVDGTPQQLQEIEDGLRGLTKILPSSHEEIAAVAEAAGQLGVQAKSVVAFTRTMVDLGETTNLSSDEAATAIAQLMNIMQTAPGDVDRLGSALVALGNNGASTEKDIILMAQRIAGAGKIIGLTEAEVLSFANALASAGIDVEAGGSAISRIMTDIAKQVSTNGEDLEKWADVAGMSAADFSKAFEEDPAQAINSFIQGLGEMNAAGGDVFSTLEDLGQSDIRVSNALLSMANAGDLLTGSLEMGNKAWEDNNALQQEAYKRYQTTESQMQIMQNRVADAAITFGEALLPAIRDVTGFVGGLADGLGAMDPELQSVIVQGGLVTGAVLLMGGTMLLAVPKAVELVGAVRTLSATMPVAAAGAKGFASFMSGPWGLGLAAGVVSVMLFEHHLNSLKSTSEELQNALFTAKDAGEIFDDLGKGREFSAFRDVTADLGNMSEMLDKVKELDDNVFLRLGNNETFGFQNALRTAGQELADIAESDLPSAQRAFKLLADETDGSKAQLETLLSRMGPYREALVKQAKEQGINVTTDDEALNLKRLLKIATGENTEVTKTAAEEYSNAADEVATLAAELDKMIAAVNEANGVGQDAVSTNAAYQDSLQTVKDYIAEAKKGTEGYSKSVDESTAAGAANADMFRGQAEASQTAAKAQYDLDLKTMSSKDATDKYIAALSGGRQKLYDNILALTGNADAAQKLTDKVYGIPDTHQTKILMDTAAATAAIDKFVRDLRNIPGRRDVVINQVVKQTGAARGEVGAAYEADGGRVDFYANGGRSENHIAQFARAGTMRVWAEPETGGEYYIPVAPTKRGRSTEILAMAANEFGYQLVPAGAQSFADGGRAGASPVSSHRGGDFNLTVVNPISRDPVREMREAAEMDVADQYV